MATTIAGTSTYWAILSSGGQIAGAPKNRAHACILFDGTVVIKSGEAVLWSGPINLINGLAGATPAQKFDDLLNTYLTGPTTLPSLALTDLTDISMGGCGTGANPPHEGDLLQFDGISDWKSQPALWDDLRTPANSLSAGPNIRPPAFTQFRNNTGSDGVWTWQFSNTQEQELFFAVQLPHSYEEGSDMEPHLHVSLGAESTGNSGNVQFGLEYTIANVNDVFGVTQTLLSDIRNYTAGSTRFSHDIIEFPTLVGTGLKISVMILCRLYRRVSTPGNFNGPVRLLEIDFHYQRCGCGSTLEFTK